MTQGGEGTTGENNFVLFRHMDFINCKKKTFSSKEIISLSLYFKLFLFQNDVKSPILTYFNVMLLLIQVFISLGARVPPVMTIQWSLGLFLSRGATKHGYNPNIKYVLRDNTGWKTLCLGMF